MPSGGGLRKARSVPFGVSPLLIAYTSSETMNKVVEIPRNHWATAKPPKLASEAPPNENFLH